MDHLSIIRRPIEAELADFNALFGAALTHPNGLLGEALSYIRQRVGKQMRPMLIMLMAKNFGSVSKVTQHSAVGLELLHTASLVHDDVVDESGERRGQASVNATFDNKVAVLVGDYLLSTALLNVAQTNNNQIVTYLSQLGQTLAEGEILQLSNVNSHNISEDVYFEVIKRKTAALFEACCTIGALSALSDRQQGESGFDTKNESVADMEYMTPDEIDDIIEQARLFGQHLGIAFQIRDDIFDYYESAEIGKPTGNDMAEGKLTLPVLYALNSTQNEEMITLAYKVKDHEVTPDEIARLVEFTKQHGGIEYAEQRMNSYSALCHDFIDKNSPNPDIATALHNYVDFVIKRKK